MKSTLSVLAIALSIALTDANVEVFSEDALSKLQIFEDVDSPEVTAKFINSNIKLELYKPDLTDGDTMLLERKSISNQEHAVNHHDCGRDHAISIDNDKVVFCRISHYGFKVTKSQDNSKTFIEIILLLKSPDNKVDFILDVPVFLLPSEYATPDNTLVKNWARGARVGVTSPVTVKQLENILHDESIIIRFGWLVEVLAYKVRDIGSADSLNIYATRPLLLRENIIESIIEAAELFKQHTEDKKRHHSESESSTNPAGMADRRTRRRTD